MVTEMGHMALLLCLSPTSALPYIFEWQVSVTEGLSFFSGEAKRINDINITDKILLGNQQTQFANAGTRSPFHEI